MRPTSLTNWGRLEYIACLFFIVDDSTNLTKTVMRAFEPVHYEGYYCDLRIDSPAEAVVVLTISGSDVGEFGAAPMAHLEKYESTGSTVELYIDARETRSASVEVSNDWAQWLAGHKESFSHISMLTGSKFIQITAGFVRSFSNLEERMRIYTDESAFDRALAASIVTANRN